VGKTLLTKSRVVLANPIEFDGVSNQQRQ